MSATTLKDELLAMGLFDNEPEAIQGWAAAFRTYFEDAVAGAVPVETSALDAPESAMAGAMTGLSTSGASAIQAGVIAFWAALVAAPAVYFVGATLITPPLGLSGLAAALTTVFANNTATKASASTAYAAISGANNAANTGGTATFPGPVVEPIT